MSLRPELSDQLPPTDWRRTSASIRRVHHCWLRAVQQLLERHRVGADFVPGLHFPLYSRTVSAVQRCLLSIVIQSLALAARPHLVLSGGVFS